MNIFIKFKILKLSVLIQTNFEKDKKSFKFYIWKSYLIKNNIVKYIKEIIWHLINLSWCVR